MTVTIRNKQVERLLDEVVALTGEGKTEAIGRALEERRDRLVQGVGAAGRLRRVLESEIWPSIPAQQLGHRLGKREDEAILGFDQDGV